MVFSKYAPRHQPQRASRTHPAVGAARPARRAAVRGRRDRRCPAGRRARARRGARDFGRRRRRGRRRHRFRVCRRPPGAARCRAGAVVPQAGGSIWAGAARARPRPGPPRVGQGGARRRHPVGRRGRAARPRSCRRSRRDRPPADGRRAPLAARRRALRRHPFPAAPLAQRRRGGGRARAAERRRHPLAGQRAALSAPIPTASSSPVGERRRTLRRCEGLGTGDRPAALANGIAAGARRRAGSLGCGGRRCDGSCISFCRIGRSTGCAG